MATIPAGPWIAGKCTSKPRRMCKTRDDIIALWGDCDIPFRSPQAQMILGWAKC